MNFSAFEKSAVFYLDNVRYRVNHFVPDDQEPDNVNRTMIVYESMRGLYEQKPLGVLLDLYAKSRLRFEGAMMSGTRSLEIATPDYKETAELPAGLTEEMLQTIEYRRGYLEFILDYGAWRTSADYLRPLIGIHAENIKDDDPPSYRTVRRWYKRYRANRFSPMSLLPLHHKKGGDSSTYTAKELEIYNRYLDKYFMTRQRRSLRDAYNLMKAELQLLNRQNPDHPIRIPTLSKFYSLKNQIPMYERDLAREGRQAANLQYNRGRRGPQVTQVLERVEVDHTRLDLEVCCSETGLVLGTPTLTVLLDAASREVLGFYVSFAGPGVNSILGALTHAILPKTYVREKYPGIQLDWPAFGIPNVLVLDNEISHHSPEFQRACTNLGITLHYCPAKDPTQKGRVERFFRTLNESLIHQLPGTTFSSWAKAGDYESEKNAVISFDHLIEMIHLWIIDVYGNAVHRGLETTPHAAWGRLVKQNPPRLPDDVSLLNQKILNVKTAVLQRYGVDINNLRYQSSALMALLRQVGEKKSVEVRYDEENVGSIFVVIPGTSETVEVPCSNPEYANGLSLVLHRALRKRVRQDGEDASKKDVMLNALLRFRDLERESAVLTKKAARRARAKQRGTSSGAASKSPVTKPVNTGKVAPKTGFFTGKAAEIAHI